MNAQYKRDFLRAGALACQVLSYGKTLIKKGASYNAIIAKVRQKIIELGGRPAFPPQIALSQVAAHFLPAPGEEIILSDELVKLDVGVCYNGAIGDSATTVDLSGKHQGLIESAESALLAAEQSIQVGQKVSDIGRIIETTIASYGYKPIKNLSGHGLGPNKIHTSPNIPNYEDKSTAIIRPGMTFAIEPFATTGKGSVYEAGNPMIFSFARDRPLSSKSAHALLEKIKAFQGLPFAIHDLLEASSPLLETKFILAELLHAGIIIGYPPLVEEGHGMVAQAENSVLVDEKGEVFVTTRLDK